MTLTEAALVEEQERGWLCGRCGTESGGDERCAECGAVLVSRHFPRMPRRLGPVVAAVAVVAVVAAAATVATAVGRGESRPAASPVASASPAATSPATPAEEDPARLQAAAVDRLLEGSTAARSGLVDAIADVRMCRTSGLSDIRTITEARRDQLAFARALRVDALDGGDAMRSALLGALSTSYQADAAFAAWGRGYVNRGCVDAVEQDTDYRRGVRLSEEADTAKTRFTDLWNPIATSFGLQERSRTTI